jgi:hypothetical protein
MSMGPVLIATLRIMGPLDCGVAQEMTRLRISTIISDAETKIDNLFIILSSFIKLHA